jgi:preprotein translocase subunit YajC
MTNLLALIAAPTTATTVAKKTTGSSNYELIVIVVIFAVVYFAFIRPRSRKQRAARTQGTPMELGDRVMSVGGIYGTVVAIHDAEGGVDPTVEVEVAPGMVLTFLRRAVNVRPRPAGTEDPPVEVGDQADDADDEQEDGTFTEPEPYGDFDERGEFHEHGQTPTHDEGPHPEAGNPAGPGAPRSTGGTGSEDD